MWWNCKSESSHFFAKDIPKTFYLSKISLFFKFVKFSIRVFLLLTFTINLLVEAFLSFNIARLDLGDNLHLVSDLAGCELREVVILVQPSKHCLKMPFSHGFFCIKQLVIKTCRDFPTKDSICLWYGDLCFFTPEPFVGGFSQLIHESRASR